MLQGIQVKGYDERGKDIKGRESPRKEGILEKTKKRGREQSIT